MKRTHEYLDTRERGDGKVAKLRCQLERTSLVTVVNGWGELPKAAAGTNVLKNFNLEFDQMRDKVGY